MKTAAGESGARGGQLSGREKEREQRMQKTYIELFKLQNLLEKTVRSIAVSNNLNSVGNSELAQNTPRSGDGANSAKAGGGRPYYPGSPVKGECFS